jgi:MFS family permease
MELISPYLLAFVSFIIMVVIFNLAMAFYRAPIVALMPDKVIAKNRSTGNAIINLMGGIGTGIGFLVPIGISALPIIKNQVVSTGIFETQNYFVEDFTIFFVTAMLLVFALILFLIFVKEVPTGKRFWHLADEPINFDVENQKVLPKDTEKKEMSEEQKRKENSLLYDLKEVVKEPEKSGIFILLAVFAWFFGYNALEANFSRWTQEYLLLKGALIGQLFLGLPIALVVVGIPAAKIAEKLGRKNTIRLGLILEIFALGLMILVQELLRTEVLGGQETPNIWGLALCIALLGVGWALININSITIVWQLAPKDKIGSYTGLYYLFSQLAAILSPTIMGFILMVGENLTGPVNTWRSLIPFMLISMVCAFLFMLGVKRGEATLSKQEVEELEAKYGSDD